MAANIIDVYPAPGALGIAIGDIIRVYFDQEMDEASINTGTFILAAPDNSVVFGPGLEPIENATLEDTSLLSSPYIGGYVQGTISFERIDASGATVPDTEVDYTGDGTLWRTVAIFTPNQSLRPNVAYTVIVAGDENTSDDFDSGVKTRSVFDANPTAVTGTGTLTTYGVYEGSNTRTYTVEVTQGGATGVATYQWWQNATPLSTYNGITSTGYRELEDGIRVTFGADGTFVLGDTWEIVVVPYEILEANYEWSFNTGSGSIVTPTSSYSTSGIESLGSTTLTNDFAVSTVTPNEGAYGVEISTDVYVGEQIIIVFAGDYDIDADTITEDTLSVKVDTPIVDLASNTGELDRIVTVSGNTLTIDLEPGQLEQNNIVVITLDKSIADTEGNTLGTDYVTYFATTYSPLYTDIRRIMLDVGNALTDVNDEPIYLAILTASLEADAIRFVSEVTNVAYRNFARKEYVSCLAELLLVSGAYSNSVSSRLSKTLGDFRVSRGDSGIRALKEQLSACVEYWKIAVQSNGIYSPDTSLPPEWGVKGSLASDAIRVSRQWEPMSRPGSYRGAANATIPRYNSRRGYKTYRNRFSRGGN